MLFGSPPPTEDHLTALLQLVPSLPTEVTATASGIGQARLLLASADGGLLIAYGPQTLMQDGLGLTLSVPDGNGGGVDATLRVERAYYQVNDQTMLHLAVTGLSSRAGHREGPRYRLDDFAEATVLESTTVPPQPFGVRVADMSETGFAFLTELVCTANDLIMLTVSVGERPVTLQGRVRRVDPAPLRNRIACRTTAISDWDRAVIGRLARIQEEQLNAPDEDRQPDMAMARAQYRLEQHQLQVRMALSRKNRDS